VKQIYKLIEKMPAGEKVYELYFRIVDREIRLECGEVPYPESDNGTRYNCQTLDLEGNPTKDLPSHLPEMMKFIDEQPAELRLTWTFMIMRGLTVYQYLYPE